MKQFSTSALICCLALALVHCEKENESESSKMKVEILTPPPEGCTRKAQHGEILKMHYKGTLASDGTQFDSSIDRDEPFYFQIGVGEVIKGWDEGLMLMCVGEKRRLTIPPELGYGDKGAGDKIPGGATLIFEVELLEIRDGLNPTNVFKEVDKNGDKLISQDEVIDYMRKMALLLEDVAVSIETEEKEQNLCNTIMKKQDLDKDGFISPIEFYGSSYYKFKDEFEPHDEL